MAIFEELELTTEELEFPTKDKRRAKRRKIAFAKGKKRIQTRDEAILTGPGTRTPEQIIAFIQTYYSEKYRRYLDRFTSIHAHSKNGCEVRTPRDIWSNDEEWAKASVRRRAEAMDQENQLYRKGLIDPDDQTILDEVDDELYNERYESREEGKCAGWTFDKDSIYPLFNAA